MPRVIRRGLGGEVIGSIEIKFNKRFQVADVIVKDKGDLVPMSAVQNAMVLIDTAILQARGQRRRNNYAQRREDRIIEKEVAKENKKVAHVDPPKEETKKPEVVKPALVVPIKKENK